MLPITSSKHLTVQIITTSILITFMLLSSFIPTTECLPITSKPIESTVENLAWEAWLMVPVGQQQKSRKVTPKSIFIVPQKKNQSAPIQCPPGEHLFESRCIPTINIDTEKLIIEQLTNFVVSSGPVYDYDYDEELNDAASAEKLEGGSDIMPSSSSDTADAPLKFDIFRDNFPIGSSGSGDSSGNKDTDDENVLFIGERRRRPPIPLDADLDTQSTSYGLNHDDDAADDQSSLFLSGIDAILLPAVSGEKEKNFNFSIYQHAANATTVSTDVEILSPAAEKLTDLEQILKSDSLFLDKDREMNDKDLTTTEKSESTTDQVEIETTTMKLMDDEDVESKTEVVRSATGTEEDSTSTSTEDSSTMTTDEDEEATTTMTTEPSEEATTSIVTEEDATTNATEEDTTINVTEADTTITTQKEEEVTTMINSSTKSDEKEVTVEAKSEVTPLRVPSGDRFVYESLSEKKSPPKAVDLAAELKIINDLVARNRKLLSTTASSTEETSRPSTAWTKIIPTRAASTTIGSSSSSESTSSSRTESSTESDSSSASSSSPEASTSETPALARTNPFWWLPNGWRVDRTADAERPLLLRFWSALTSASGSQTKV